jgi:hypothetical protein
MRYAIALHVPAPGRMFSRPYQPVLPAILNVDRFDRLPQNLPETLVFDNNCLYIKTTIACSFSNKHPQLRRLKCHEQASVMALR